MLKGYVGFINVYFYVVWNCMCLGIDFDCVFVNFKNGKFEIN